jgi:hypothetical protein
MADLSISLAHGVQGLAPSDFTVGTSSPGAGDIELRVNDVDGNGNKITRLDIINALQAFERALIGGFVTTAQE